MSEDDFAVEVRGLTLGYVTPHGLRTVVHDVGFALRPGESLGLIGESGSGKSTIALAMMGHLAGGAKVAAGTVLVHGVDVLRAPARRLRELRAHTIAMVAQDAASALNPSMRVGAQIVEAIRASRSCEDPWAEALELLRRVRIIDPEATLRRYPHELSGGQQQRAFIAMVLAARPQVVIFDEPTTGLDASVEAEVLELIEEIRRRENITTVFISHNLGLVQRVCGRVGVLFEGHLVECGPTAQVLGRPQHAYSDALLRCIPGPGYDKTTRPVASIPDEVIDAVRVAIREGRTLPPAPRATFVAEVGVTRETGPDLVRVENVTKSYGRSTVLHDVSLTIPRGAVVGLIGESGSGKSTLARIIAGLTTPDSGTVMFEGRRLPDRISRRTRQDREAIQMVYQNPDGTLNPRITIGAALRRAIRMLRGSGTVADLLASVRLTHETAARYPRALSGGQKQRVAIARAIAGASRLVLADEPVSALDTSVQAGVLGLLAQLQEQDGTSMLFISHDMNVVRYIADEVVVLLHGRIVEHGPADEVFARPQHEYTRQLLDAAAALHVEGADGPRIAELPPLSAV